jgi:LCP family protein required for cell wall assembly
MTPAEEYMMKSKRTPALKNRSTTFVVLSVILILIIACLAGFGAYLATRQLTIGLAQAGKLGPDLGVAAGTPQVNAEGTVIPPLPGEMGASDPLIASAELTPWDGAGRVTVLMLGLDYRDWEAQTDASRSDTMILLTLDPQTKTAGILSIPRDMWVSIPGFKHGKINTAYYLGDSYKLPGGGPALAVKTVESFLGVPINYYAQVDFGAFVRFVDEIGGVKIDVPQEIKIDLLGTGPKTKKKLQPGIQTLPGEWALAYARNRYTEGGDFDRARRQQQVIMALRDKVVSTKILPILIEKAPTLYNEIASGIRTNLTLEEVIKLALLAKDVPEESIKRGVIDKGDVYFGFSPDGLSILIPIPDDIHTLRDEIFATSGSLGPQTPGNSQEQMKAEAARIILYNGSGDPSLADRTAGYLREQGANITQVAAADQSYAATTVIDHTGSPYALKYLSEWMGIAPGKIVIQFDPNAASDVELYLGTDWASRNSLP